MVLIYAIKFLKIEAKTRTKDKDEILMKAALEHALVHTVSQATVIVKFVPYVASAVQFMYEHVRVILIILDEEPDVHAPSEKLEQQCVLQSFVHSEKGPVAAIEDEAWTELEAGDGEIVLFVDTEAETEAETETEAEAATEA